MKDSSHEAEGSAVHVTPLHDRRPRKDGGDMAGPRMGVIQLLAEKVGGMGLVGAVLARERKCTVPKSLGEVVIFPRVVLPCC